MRNASIDASGRVTRGVEHRLRVGGGMAYRRKQHHTSARKDRESVQKHLAHCVPLGTIHLTL